MDSEDQKTRARQLREATRALLLAYGAFDDVRRPCGTTLSTPHAYALIELLQGPMSVAALAARLNIDRTNVSRLCMKMEDAGELIRAPDAQDRRVKRLRLTPQGERAARNIDGLSVAHFARVLETLDVDDASVLESLRALTDSMRQQRLNAGESDEVEDL